MKNKKKGRNVVRELWNSVAEAIPKGQPVAGRESEIVFSWICLLIKEQLDKTIVKFR
jgi:hypothetical protein